MSNITKIFFVKKITYIQFFTNLRKSFGGFSSEEGARTASRYLTLVETCKLIKKAPQEVFRNFFDMIVAGRRGYENMSSSRWGYISAS